MGSHGLLALQRRFRAQRLDGSQDLWRHAVAAPLLRGGDQRRDKEGPLPGGPAGALSSGTDAPHRAALSGWTGQYVLLTNDDTLTPEDVDRSYKTMMIIEACFRRMKAM